MSVICQNFVQNAWRKDLCSNCFKSEADHAASGCRNSLDRLSTAGRYIPQAATLYQSRGIATNIHWRPLLADPGSKLQQGRLGSRDFGSQNSLIDDHSDQRFQQLTNLKTDASRGILKDSTPSKIVCRPSVGFSPEEPLVIGYGGRDYDSDDSPWELGSDDGSINLELLDVTDEDRTITKLTKNNTEFNSVNENLIPTPPPIENLVKSKVRGCNSLNNMNGNSEYNPSESPVNNLERMDNSKNKTNLSNGGHENKLDYYYFPSKNQSLQSSRSLIQERANFLTEAINFSDDCKEMSIIAKDIPGILNNIQNNNIGERRYSIDNLNESNTRTLIEGKLESSTECQTGSENGYHLEPKPADSETGSDSDYSTSKQNNGESSTDTESFHDAEDTPMVPCSSFLHGKVQEDPSAESRSHARNSIAKPFETSSVSSSDMSTFSDDSDSHKNQDDSYKQTKQTFNQNRETVCEIKLQSKNVSAQPEMNPVQNETRHDESGCKKITVSQSQSSQMSSSTYKSVPLYIHKKASPPDDDGNSPIVFEKNVSSNKGNAENHNLIAHQNKKDRETSKNMIKGEKFERKEEIRNQLPYHLSERAFSDKKKTTANESKSVDTVSMNRNAAGRYTPTGRMSSYVTDDVTPKTKSNSDGYSEQRSHAKPSAECFQTTAAVQSNPIADGQRISVQEPRRPLECEDYTDPTEIHHSYPVDDQNRIYDSHGSTDSNSSSTRNSPNSAQKRQSKLAALALELEKARCDAASASKKELKQPLLPQDVAEYAMQNSKPSNEKVKAVPENKDTFQNGGGSKPTSIRRGFSLVSTTQNGNASSLPDLLPENTTKTKKSRFSLKKLLKRSKDSDTLVINNPNDYNPKAWKNQTFDRSRLSLEIIHPMDLNNDSPPSTSSTPTEDKTHVFSNPSGKKHGRGSTPRARSLSALPQLVSCITDLGDLPRHEMGVDTITSLDRPRIDMTRKAGTVAERSKKYKAPRRTPSFSELRTSLSTSGPSLTNGAACQRPPKPPPPPRGKSLQPPPQPPSVPAPIRDTAGVNSQPLPNRPPPLKAADTKEPSSRLTNSALEASRCYRNSDSDYANLGDIRLNITPKKPQRPSAVSFARDTLEMDAEITYQEDTESSNCHEHSEQQDNTYESLEAPEEEDHYTYLDEIQAKNAVSAKGENPAPKRTPPVKQSPTSEKIVRRVSEPASSTTPRPSSNMGMKKPWMDLQASYAAIAAANYESLAELITTAISEGLENLQKSAASLKWNDFNLEPEEPIQILEDKIVYNASHKNEPKTKVTLMVTTQKQHSQHGRNPPRPPILATFSDYLSRQYLNTDAKSHHNYADSTKAIIYVLQRAKATTVGQFAQDSASFQANQHIHLRNACFVLLQLIHTLKSLQAEGIEEIDYDLGHILLLQTDVDKPPILVLLPGDKVYLTMADFYKADVATRKTTLCQTTLQLLFHLLQIQDVSDLNTCVVNGEQLAAPVAHTFSVISKILSEEKASSLTQAKGLLEYMLWGPVDIKMTNNEDDIDVILQRWLDLQRAQMVKSIVSNLHLKISSHTGFHVYEEYQLIFLLQATVKSLKDIISKL